MLHILLQYHTTLLHGCFVTLELLGIIMCVGIPLGVLCGIAAGMHHELLRVVRSLHFVSQVIPVLVILFWFHYPLQALLQVSINPFWTSVVALGGVNAVSVAAIVSNELARIPRAYIESAHTLGLKRLHIARYIELPLLLRASLPHIITQQAAMLEYTLLTSLISVQELFRTAQTLNAQLYQPVEIYSLLIIFFFLILTPIHLGSRMLRKKYFVSYV
ncbi:MAG: ABC transporter permease subunit [Candidatus Kerfeldbacteria bacterium]|nr:ABC transporter permease subunit [Candidatus Kerfeldbacteria bacterium]